MDYITYDIQDLEFRKCGRYELQIRRDGERWLSRFRGFKICVSSELVNDKAEVLVTIYQQLDYGRGRGLLSLVWLQK